MKIAEYFDPIGRFTGGSVTRGELVESPAETLDRALASRTPTLVRQADDNDAVLMDAGSFAQMYDSLRLYEGLLVGMGELDRGEGIPHEQVMEEMRRKLQAMGTGSVKADSNVAVAV